MKKVTHAGRNRFAERLQLVALLLSFCCAGNLYCAQDSFVDEFQGDTLGPRWEWYTPHSDPAGEPSYELTGETVSMGFPAGGDYDTWLGFDRMPRIRTSEFETEDNFRIETHMTVEEPMTADYFHTGLWIEFIDQEGGPVDGWFYGFYSRPGWQGNYTIRAERAGHRSPASADDFPVPWEEPEASFKVERIEDSYTFFYREGDEDPWEVLHTAESEGAEVTHVGMFAKNWVSGAGIRASYDYFLLDEPESAPPEIAEPHDTNVLLGAPYCSRLRLVQGFPLPEWEIQATPSPSSAPAINENGLVTWTADTADAGKTFTFEATSTNTVGSASLTWDVPVREQLMEEFEDPDPPGMFEFYTPQDGPVLETVDGWAEISHEPLGAGELDFNTWLGLDRMPRLRVPLGLCGDFVAETMVNVNEPLLPGSTFHCGLWIRFEGGSLDGEIWGPYMDPQNLRLERIGIHYTDESISSVEEVGLRIERRGDLFTYSYREGDEGEWIEYLRKAMPEVRVDFVGLCEKTWGESPPAARISFDYLSVLAGETKPPQLEDPCPEMLNFATPGDLFSKQLDYLPGTPNPTNVTVDGPGSFDPQTGLYTLTPESTGSASITVKAEMPGAPAVSVSFPVCVLDDPVYEDFDVQGIESLAEEWELYDPASIIPSPFSIVDEALEISVPPGQAYDHWITIDNAPQVRVLADEEPALAGNFVAETKVRLVNYSQGALFHTGIALGFGLDFLHMYYWGPYMGTGLRCERSGMNNLFEADNPDETVTLRIRRECNKLYFSFKPESTGEWQLSGIEDISWGEGLPENKELSWAGIILKTWGGGAGATVAFDYFDIIQSDQCAGTGPVFLRGDTNVDGKLDISDAISVLGHIFGTGPLLSCYDSGDCNDDGKIDIADAIALLNSLFVPGTGPLPAPSGTCSTDPTEDTLPECVYDEGVCP